MDTELGERQEPLVAILRQSDGSPADFSRSVYETIHVYLYRVTMTFCGCVVQLNQITVQVFTRRLHLKSTFTAH